MLPDDAAPIPPEFTHKHRAEESLLRSYRPVLRGEEIALFLAPGWDGGTEPGTPESILRVAEALRQSVIAAAHLAHEVPLGDAFVMERMRFSGATPRTTRSTGVRVAAGSPRIAGGRLVSMIAAVTFLAEGETVLRGEGHLRVVTAPVYRRMREGRIRSDALRSETPIAQGFTVFPSPEGGFAVAYDARHPLFFDHPVDHVPGMLLIAVALETFASRFPSRAIAELDARFLDFIELDDSRILPMRMSSGRTALRSLSRTRFGPLTRPSAVIDVYSASTVPLSIADAASPSAGVSASMSVE